MYNVGVYMYVHHTSELTQ